MRRLFSLVLALGLGAMPLAGSAVTIVVTTADDTGTAATCTLRQAIVAVNAASLAGTSCVNSGTAGFHANDIINFSGATFPSNAANTITLSGTTLTVTGAALTIDATANGQLTIQRPVGADSSLGIFYQGQPGGGSLTLKHLDLKNSRANAAIWSDYNNGVLTLLYCNISGSLGSGIDAASAVTLTNSSISSSSGGTVGGINSRNSLTLINSTVSGNWGSVTGGIDSSGTVALYSSTISGNQGGLSGGGIYSSGSVTLTNSTISGNTAPSGGGIACNCTLKLTNSTVSGNAATVGDGGGLFADSMTIVDSIVAGNTQMHGGDVFGSVTAASTGNFIGGDPQLGALANNGGFTPTMLPMPGSPVIDAIACTLAPTDDQRAVLRPQGTQCDIGAVEVTPTEATFPPLITKAFGVAVMPQGATTSLSFTLSNPNPVASLTTSFTDSLPAGLVVATPNGLTNTCGGTATAVAGASSASLSGASIAAGANCTMVVNVLGATIGVKNNSVQVTAANSGVGNTSNATLTVVTPLPPSIAEEFGAAVIELDATMSLTFTIDNANVFAMTGVAFTDSLPAGLVVATPNGLTNTCGGTATAAAGATAASLSGVTLAPGASCTMVVSIRGTTVGVKNNSVQVTSTNAGAGNTSNASVTVAVLAPPTIAKAFGAAVIDTTGTTSLSFTLGNPHELPLTGVGFVDNFPAGLVVATPNGLTNACGGAATAVAGASSASLSGAALAAGATCTVVVNVLATTSGVKNNSVQVTSSNGGTGNTSNATLTVSAVQPPAIAKYFGAPSVDLNGTTYLIFNLSNPNASAALTGIAFTDNLPAGMVVAAPNGLLNTCGGTTTAVGGAASASLSGATLAAGASCQMAVVVQATTLGMKTNSVQVTSANGGTGNTSLAGLLVAPPQLNLFLFDLGNGYADYGQVAVYYIELYNTAAGTTSTMAVTLSAGFDTANATLTCVSGAGSCSASASHVLSDSANVPQGTAAIWALAVQVLPSASGNTVQVTVDATGATPATTDAIDTLVIFRDGFDGNPFATGAVLAPDNVADKTLTPPVPLDAP